MMKTIALLLSILWCLTAEAQYNMLFHMKGGANQVVRIPDIDSVSFVDDFQLPPIGEGSKVFYCGKDRILSTLKQGIEMATRYMGATLYVDEGEYDLVDEFGQEWFDNMTEDYVLSGLVLKNNVHVIFSTKSKVISHYEGTNQYATSLYSPFNAGEYGFFLENLTLECSNCRYAVHDERNGGTEQCTSKYLNCHFAIDNSQNQAWPYGSTAIGGGLGSDAEVIISGCTFSLVDDDPRNAIYYHQSNDMSNPDHKCSILIENCYMYQGTVALDFYRTDAKEESLVKVCNNSFASVRSQASNGLFLGGYDSLPDNVHTCLLVWGNEIRK